MQCYFSYVAYHLSEVETPRLDFHLIAGSICCSARWELALAMAAAGLDLWYIVSARDCSLNLCDLSRSST